MYCKLKTVMFDVYVCVSAILYFFCGYSFGNDVFAKEGDLIILNCPVNSRNPPVSWYGPPNLRIFSDGIYVAPELDHVRIAGRPDIGEFNLEIQNFTERAAGDYRCSALIGDEEHEENFRVILKRPPTNLHIVNKSGDGYIQGTEGQNMTLECIVNNGVPPETITWRRNNRKFSTTKGNNIFLSLIPSRSDNLAIFTCSTDGNLLTEPLTDIVKLNIKYPPKVEITGGSTLRTIEGSTLTILCRVDSNPEPENIKWKDQNGDTVFIGETLVLPLINRRESGMYRCLATNEIGNDYRDVFVIVQFPPDVSIEKRSSLTGYVLECKGRGLPSNYTYLGWEHFSENGLLIRKLHGQNTGTLTVLSDSYQNSGKYTCTVTNGIPDINGNKNKNATVSLKIMDVPKFVMHNENIEYGMFNKPFEFSLNVYSYPPEIHGTISIENGTSENVTIRNDFPVVDVFHGIRVQLEGSEVSYILPKIHNTDFKKYTFNVSNQIGHNSYTVELRAAEPPVLPRNVTATSFSNGFAVSWISGFNGGFQQQFYIQYRVANSDVWSTVGAINDTRENSFRIDGLIPDQFYEFQMFSVNKHGRSNLTKIYEVLTHSNSTLSKIWLLMLIGGGSFIISIVAVAVVCSYRKLCILRRSRSLRVQTVEENNTHIYDEIEVVDENPVPTIEIVPLDIVQENSVLPCRQGPEKFKVSCDDSSSESSRGSDSENPVCLVEDYLNPYYTLTRHHIEEKGQAYEYLQKSSCGHVPANTSITENNCNKCNCNIEQIEKPIYMI